MKGKIVRGVAGFYYVYTEAHGIVECRARGIFRNQRQKPLVGDNVLLEILDTEEKTGQITRILERENQLIRPAVANVSQAVVIFAISYPKPNLNLLDRFLLMMGTQELPVVICFNKSDDSTDGEQEKLRRIYENSGFCLHFTSTVTGAGMEELRERLVGKTSVFAGPSGVGKSSVMNVLFPEARMETGAISEKIKRGRHTTRHSELFYLGEDTYVMDTPGFTSLGLPALEKEQIREYYAEFADYQGSCRFLGCVHIHEPGCAVRQAVQERRISQERYENYQQFYEELRLKKKY